MKLDNKDKENLLSVCTNITEYRVINSILNTVNVDLIWYSNSDTRQKISEEVTLSDARLKQVIAGFCKKGILIKKTKGIYTFSRKFIQTGKFTE